VLNGKKLGHWHRFPYVVSVKLKKLVKLQKVRKLSIKLNFKIKMGLKLFLKNARVHIYVI